MSYEESKAQVEALGEYLMGKRDQFQKDAEAYVGQRFAHMMHSPSEKDLDKPCRESYGWCWVHMAKALPPKPVMAVGPFSASNELEIDLRDVNPEVLRLLDGDDG